MLSTKERKNGEDCSHKEGEFEELRDAVSNLSITFKQENKNEQGKSGEDGSHKEGKFEELKDAVSSLSITFKQEIIAHLLKSIGTDEGSEVTLDEGPTETGETKTITMEEVPGNITIDLCVFNCISRSNSEELSPELGTLKLLGEGGFGVAYKYTPSLATNTTTVMDLVIKGFFEQDNDNPKSSCQRETNMRKLSHPNIIKYFDEHIHVDGCRYDIIEYGGQSVQKRYLKIKEMPELEIKKAMLSVASGLEYLHTATGPGYIVHRDIRSDNITVNDGGVYKIIDFGISSRTTAENSRFESNTNWGNPFWKSPEFCRYMKTAWLRESSPGIPAPGRKSDVWSFGVFGLEMISFPKRPDYFEQHRYNNRCFGSDAYITDLMEGKVALTDFVNTQNEVLADILTRCFTVEEEMRIDSKTLKKLCESSCDF